MRKILSYILPVFLWIACSKDNVLTSKDVFIYTSLPYDTLHFDKNFSGVLSPLKLFKIFNYNEGTIRIDEITLLGGDQSNYRININGLSTPSFKDIYLEGKDSLYVFATVNPLSDSVQLHKILDSIVIKYNGKEKKIYLATETQKVAFLSEQVIQKDTLWTNQLPIVVKGDITVASNACLTIEKGTKVYFAGNTGLSVEGRLHVEGSYAKDDRVHFLTDRLDYDYYYLPGLWKGVSFGTNSKNNKLKYLTIHNAKAALSDTANTIIPTSSKLMLEGVVIQNCLTALNLRTTYLDAVNTLIANCQNSLQIKGGGHYLLNHCTMASFGNAYVSRTHPIVVASDGLLQNNTTHSLQFILQNSIVYGSLLDEFSFQRIGNDFDARLVNVLCKATAIAHANTSNVWLNEDPMFVTLENRTMDYDFSLKSLSPAKNRAIKGMLDIDITGKKRSQAAPSLGCYE